MQPTIVFSSPGKKSVTFCWPETPNHYVGYRFVEHQPHTSSAPLAGLGGLPRRSPAADPSSDRGVPAGLGAWPEERQWRATYADANPEAPVQMSFQAYADGTAQARAVERLLEREIAYQPAEDGVWLWMRLTAREAFVGACAVQQCLRYTGAANQPKRRPIAHVPFLSEFELQAAGWPDRTLTFARQAGAWVQFPVQQTLFHAAPGASLPGLVSAGEVDHGLIVRETLDRQSMPQWYWDQVAPNTGWERIATGMYWERTVALSNRHPADCVHAWVDFGPLAAGQSRSLWGKFYYLEGAKDDLLARWRRDFPEGNREV